MRLQLISDLHLEFHESSRRLLGQVEIAPDIDVLVVAGDTVVPNRQHEQNMIPFFKWASAQAKDVIFLVGNHEYYGSDDSSYTDIRLAALVGLYPNVHWLRNEEITLHGFHFFGGPMWFPDKDGLNQLYEKNMNDFSQIKDFRHWVYRDHANFEYYAQRMVGPETIVVTHYLPAPGSTPEIYRGSMLNRFFVSDQTDFIMERQPRLWLHGHTHAPCDYMMGKTRVLCNPLGYPSEHMNKPYPPIVVEI